MTDHAELIARLEAAPEGSRELDRLIARHVGVGAALHNDTSGISRALDYTTSLDAKLPGENIESVALDEVVEGEPLGTAWEAWHFDPETRRPTMGAGHTEVLARRVAALKALGPDTCKT